MTTYTNGTPPPHTFTISPDQQRAVLQGEIDLWLAERYRMDIRRRIQVRAGGNADLISEINSRLAQCEVALDLLSELLGELPPAQAE